MIINLEPMFRRSNFSVKGSPFGKLGKKLGKMSSVGRISKVATEIITS